MKNSILFLLYCYFSMSNAHELLEVITEQPPSKEVNLPFMASIHIWLFDLFLICGGAIISENWVLTAAHCNAGPFFLYYVVVGTDNYLDKKNARRISTKVQHFYIHPKYPIAKVRETGIEAPNDIGLLKLSKSLSFNKHVNAIRLPENSNDVLQVGDEVLFAGYGMPAWWIPYASLRLQISKYSVVSFNDCNETLLATGLKFNLDETMICVDYKKQRNTCRGDSGSPLYVKTATGFKLYGSDSWGVAPCFQENGPGVFTSIALQLQWIESVMKKKNTTSWF